MIDIPKNRSLKSQGMKLNFVLIFCALLNPVCNAQEADHFTMKGLREVADVAESRSPDDAEVVRKIAAQLDLLKGKTEKLDVHNKGVLIELATFVYPGLRPDEVAAAEDKRRKILAPYADVQFRPDMDGKELLYYSAGTLGVPIDQRGMMDQAKNSGVPLPMRLRALKAIQGQKHVLPVLEEDLIALGQDEINFSADGHIGPRTDKRYYPIREASAAILKKMKENPTGDDGNGREPKRPAGEIDEKRNVENTVNSSTENKSDVVSKNGEGTPNFPAVWWIAAIGAIAAGGWLFLKKRAA